MKPKRNKGVMGRPPGPPEQVRSLQLMIRMTPAEHATASKIARKLGRPMGTLMRELLLERAREVLG